MCFLDILVLNFVFLVNLVAKITKKETLVDGFAFCNYGTFRDYNNSVSLIQGPKWLFALIIFKSMKVIDMWSVSYGRQTSDTPPHLQSEVLVW